VAFGAVRRCRALSGGSGLPWGRSAGQTVSSHSPRTRASGGTADALASGASVRKDVGVQIPPCALG
jgi:hypothetical protein